MRILIRGATEIEIVIEAASLGGDAPDIVTSKSDQSSAAGGTRAQSGTHIILPEGVEPPSDAAPPVLSVPGGGDTGTSGNEAGLAPVAANPSSDGVEVRHAEARNMPGYDPGEDSRSAPSRLVGSSVREAAIVPCAGVTPGSEDTLPDIPAAMATIREARVGIIPEDSPSLAEGLASLRTRILHHVANPPAPVAPAVELDLRRRAS